jgi:hypothetical protein
LPFAKSASTSAAIESLSSALTSFPSKITFEKLMTDDEFQQSEANVDLQLSFEICHH